MKAQGARALAGAAILTLLAITAAQGQHARGPFDVLEWKDGVTTSRDGYSLWISVPDTTHKVKLPGHARVLEGPDHRVTLHVACRAPGGPHPYASESTPPVGGIHLDNHPEQPPAYTVLHPMNWLLELAGRHIEQWPVDATVGDAAALSGTLARALTDYSARRPGVDLTLPPTPIMDAMSGERPIALQAEGPDFHLEATFRVARNAREAAALMREHCPNTARKRSQRRAKKAERP